MMIMMPDTTITATYVVRSFLISSTASSSVCGCASANPARASRLCATTIPRIPNTYHPLPVNWYGTIRITYASNAYSGAATAINQPGPDEPGNNSLITSDARINPGISEIALGASWSIASIASVNGTSAVFAASMSNARSASAEKLESG